jgi:hypothetical protein
MPIYTTGGKPGNRQLPICSCSFKIQKHIKNKVLTDAKHAILSRKFAAAI